MPLIKRSFVVKFLLLISIFLFCFLSIEIYLHKKYKNQENKEPYKLSFCIHTGERISKKRGDLKLSIAPFTIYKNLPNQKTKAFKINSQGFRGSEISKISGKLKRIIVVGGSAAFGVGCRNDDETFEILLEKLDNKYEVINAGVIGFHSGQELTYIVTELVDYNPDIIIAYNGWNDLFFDCWISYQKKKNELGYNNDMFSLIEKQLLDNYRSQTEIFTSFKRFVTTLINKSIILSKAQQKVVGFKQKFCLSKSVKKRRYLNTQNDGYFEKIVNNYTNNLKKMHYFCQSLGIKFMVVFQPELGLKSNINSEENILLANGGFNEKNYADEFPELYRLFIKETKKVLIKEGIDFIDINTYPKFKDNSNTLFMDVVHTNKNGNKIIAEIFKKHLDKYY